MITAKCGCQFTVDDDCVCIKMEPGEWEAVAVIPTLEPPETPVGWANENIIWPHETECLEAQQVWIDRGMKIVNRLLNEEMIKRVYLDGLDLVRIVKAR